MEELKGFAELAIEEGGNITPFSPNYTEEFSQYMQKSITESKKMSVQAELESRNIIINI